MKIVVTSTHYRRPGYSLRSIGALAAQPLAAEVHYHANVDPHPTAGVPRTLEEACYGKFAGGSLSLRGGRVEVQPMISRAINIGDEGGTHRRGVPLPYWIGEAL